MNTLKAPAQPRLVVFVSIEVLFSEDYEVKWPGRMGLAIIVCQVVKTETFGLIDEIAQADAAAFVWRRHGGFAFGPVRLSYCE